MPTCHTANGRNLTFSSPGHPLTLSPCQVSLSVWAVLIILAAALILHEQKNDSANDQQADYNKNKQ
jgi:hypothetical protein